jgi:Fe-S cluster assembly iron-binding protein IscA
MIRISDSAQAHFAKLLANQEEGTQIRVFVIPRHAECRMWCLLLSARRCGSN